MFNIGKFVFSSIYSFINKFTKFKVKLLNSDAKIPQKADSGSAGYDIFSSFKITIPPGKRQLVSTGISLEVSKYFYIRIAPCKNLSVKGIDIGAGVIDSNYRGEIKVLIINNSYEDFYIETGAKIAQLIIERCSDTRIEVVDILSETERGFGGFGSTGN